MAQGISHGRSCRFIEVPIYDLAGSKSRQGTDGELVAQGMERYSVPIEMRDQTEGHCKKRKPDAT